MAENNEDNDRTRSFTILATDTIVSHYKIVSRIGAGGMGEVYLARDIHLDREVALKFLPYHLCQIEECRARFKREAQATAKLSHPNIITVFEVSEYQGRPFFAMEHIEGQSLREFSEDADIPIERILELGIQICEGLNEAHEKGVTHRDIKPSNIIIDMHGRAKIVDFGLASVAGRDQLTKTGSTLGTIGYMSPEQVQGKEIDRRSDLFSLGVVLYELITRRNPFKRDNEAATLKAISDDTPEPLARYKSDVPECLQLMVDRALDKDKQTRYQSAAGMLADLKRFKKELEPARKAGDEKSPGRRYGKIFIPSTAVLIIILLLIFRPWTFEIGTPQEAIAQENKLAIMYFENLADPDDTLKLGKITTNLLITDLSESGYVRVVSSQRLYDILKHIGRESENKVDQDIATQVARTAQAKWMLLGSILNTEPEIILTAQLIDVESGTAVASQRIEGQPGERIFPLIDRLTVEIKKDLSLPVQAMTEEDRPVMEVTTNSVEAYRYYLDGLEYKEKYYDKEAEESFRKAIDIDSTFAMAYMMLLDFTSGDEQEYILGKMNQYADNVTHREKLFIKAYNAYHSDVRDEEAYIKYLTEIVEKYPEDKLAMYYLAWYYHNPMGEFDKAKEMCFDLIRLYPYFGDVYNHLAYIYIVQNNLDSSIWAINKFIELADPDEANPFDSRGELYAFQGEIDKAIASFERAIEIKPDFAMSLHKLGNLYLFKHDYIRAESLYQVIASHSEKDTRADGRFFLHRIPLYQGRFSEALRKLEFGAETDRIELGIGEKWLRKMAQRVRIVGHYLGDKDKALRIADSLLSVINEFPEIEASYSCLAKEMAWLYAKNGNFNKADSFLSLLKTMPGRGLGADYMGHVELPFTECLISFKKGDYEYAITGLQSLKEYYPLFLIQFYLARSYYHAGHLADAVTKFEKVLNCYDVSRAYYPELSVLAHYWSGQAYEASGWNDKAIGQYETFLDLWQNADPGIEEIDDAKKRLARLRQEI